MRKAIISFSLFVICVAGLVVYNCADNPVPELTKEEALRLMDLQTQFVMIQADRDEYVRTLFLKYNLDPQRYSIDIQSGKFTLREQSNVLPE